VVALVEATVVWSYKVATKECAVKRDVRSDNRKNSKTEKPTNDFVFECVHCREAFLEYEASDAV
jgi:hypothetical protein